MELLWKTLVMVLISVLLGLSVGKQEKDLSIVLSLVVCTITVSFALTYLEPVISFLRGLEVLAELQGGILNIILQVCGVSIVSDLVSMICSDAGNASLAKAVQFLSACAILHLTIPMMQAFIDLIQGILTQ